MRDYEPFTHGYTEEEYQAEQDEFFAEHGCLSCENFNPRIMDERKCRYCKKEEKK